MQKQLIKAIVTMIALAFAAFSPVAAVGQTVALNTLFAQLEDADENSWQPIEEQIWIEWSRSGSAAMDLLLERGRKAMSAGDTKTAIEHLTALTDHAPEFAEGWNARATAYFQAGLYGQSIQDIQHTLALNPRHFGAMSGLGMILDQLGYTDEALTAFREALAIHPHRPNLKISIERLEKRLGAADL